MAAAYQPEAWFDFNVALVGACAALWGLLFISISLHPMNVGEHPVLRNRARVTLVGLCVQLVIALVCLIPRQSSLALGIELTLMWLLWLGAFTGATLQTVSRIRWLSSGFWFRTSGALLMGLCGVAAGVTLAVGHGGGLLWNVVANVLGLVLTLANAWSISLGWELEEDWRARVAARTTTTTRDMPAPAVAAEETATTPT